MPHIRTHLSYWTQTSLKLQLSNTLVCWLAHLVTFVHLPLATSTTNPYTVDDISLLCLVAEATCLVRSCRSCGPVHSCQLPVLPASYTEQKSEEVWLLLPPELLKVLVRTHSLVNHVDPVSCIECVTCIKNYYDTLYLYSIVQGVSTKHYVLIRLTKCIKLKPIFIFNTWDSSR